MIGEPNFEEDLLKDETIIWCGQPDPKKKFTSIDIFLVPFSLLWGGFAIAWEVMVTWGVFFSQSGRGTSNAGVLFPLFGIPFVIVGLYFIFGRFIYKRIKKEKIWYLVTNKRVIEIVLLRGKNVNSTNIELIPSYSKSISKDGIGTLVFGPNNWMTGMYANTGMDFFNIYGTSALAFHDIKNADFVYQLIQDQKNKQ